MDEKCKNCIGRLMRIALFTDGIFPYVIGGMQKHSYYLTKYLARKKIHVDLYHTNQSNYDIDRLEFFSDEEKRYIRSIVVKFPGTDRLPGHYLRESYKYSALLLEQYKKNEPVDFIYVKGFSGWKMLEQKAGGKKFPPIGLNFHGYEMFQAAPSFKVKLQHYLLRKPVKYCVRNADYLFSYGGEITELIKRLHVDDSRVIEIPTGIESSWLTDSIKGTGEKVRFLFVGRYERRKGIEELSAALKELVPQYDFEFHFAGPISEKKQVQSSKIVYYGQVTDVEAMMKIVRSCDVLVCPSYSEGMPNVIVEAMASGLAVIATDVGAVGLLVNSSTGWLIRPGSRRELENALTDAIKAAPPVLDAKKNASVVFIRENLLWDRIINTTIRRIKAVI